MAQIDSVVFDLGAVCLSWNPLRIIQSISEDKEVQNRLKDHIFGHNDWLCMDEGSLAEKDARPRFIERSGLPEDTVDEALMAAKVYLQEIPETMTLIDDLASAQMPLYCLSNMSKETYHFIEEKPFFDAFSGKIISGFEGTRKPFNEIFEIVIDRFQLKPANTLFIDDCEANIDTASKMGFETVHFDGSGKSYQQIRIKTQLA